MASWYAEYGKPYQLLERDYPYRPTGETEIRQVLGDRGVVIIDGRLSRDNAWGLALEAAGERGRERMGLTHVRMYKADRMRRGEDYPDVPWVEIPEALKRGL